MVAVAPDQAALRLRTSLRSSPEELEAVVILVRSEVQRIWTSSLATRLCLPPLGRVRQDPSIPHEYETHMNRLRHSLPH